MGDSVSDVILIVTEHILRRYALPLTLLTGQLAHFYEDDYGIIVIYFIFLLLTASVLRYNVYSLVYLTLFLLGVIITGPRLRANRGGCVRLTDCV